MAVENEVVFSEFIARKIEGELGKLEGRRVPAKVAIGELSLSIRATLGRGVGEDAIREVLKANGINLGQAAFRKLVMEGRPGSMRMNAGHAERAGDALKGGAADRAGAPGQGRSEGGAEGDPPGDPGRGGEGGASPDQAMSRESRQTG